MAELEPIAPAEAKEMSATLMRKYLRKIGYGPVRTMPKKQKTCVVERTTATVAEFVRAYIGYPVARSRLVRRTGRADQKLTTYRQC